ncbi:MAG: hypothetical protein Q7K45_01320 [Nanoarchaeota archaeon]|nr:hypothetical protein [Nanoarchaeota archaeon]
MIIPNTFLRQQLESLIHPAPGRCAHIDFDLVEQAGLTIMERRIPAVDLAHNYKCLWFVFAYMLREPWFSTASVPPDIFDNPTPFLANYGFNLVQSPSEGDVLAYVTAGEIDIQAHHFGIFQEGKVISKWGAGHIFRHSIEQVPTRYGEKVIFYAKDIKRDNRKLV